MSKDSNLSGRELEILDLVVTGAGNKEIADQLTISANTVKVHLRNIFSKLGVASRTEAALYAIRHGLVAVDGVDEYVGMAGSSNFEPLSQTNESALQAPERHKNSWTITLALVGILLIGILGMFILIQLNQNANGSETNPTLPDQFERWGNMADMLIPRSGLAAAVYQNKIYAIGGETLDSVSSAVEQYDPISNTWLSLAAKPQPVTDAKAAVVSGKIYIPGGRISSTELTDIVEVFDPQSGEWGQVAPLPKKLSNYAIAVFEGRIYTFGGWDGVKYLSDVNIYDPSENQWVSGTPMLIPRESTSAAVSGSAIYVMGGVGGGQALTTNEIYYPQREGTEESPWRIGSPIPEGRYDFGIASIADLIYVIGGANEERSELSLKYSPISDEWQYFSIPGVKTWTDLGVVEIETHLYLFGGRANGELSPMTLSYQAIFTVLLPQVQ